MSEPFIACILAQKERLAASDRELDSLRVELRAETDRRDAEIARLRADRRERIATACLAGMLANSSYEGSSGTFNGCAFDAVMFADALIARLDKEATP
jgi:hypothetical protein